MAREAGVKIRRWGKESATKTLSTYVAVPEKDRDELSERLIHALEILAASPSGFPMIQQDMHVWIEDGDEVYQKTVAVAAYQTPTKRGPLPDGENESIRLYIVSCLEEVDEILGSDTQ